MGKILVLGATGTVGAYTALDLKEAGFDVLAIGKRESDGGFFADHGIEYKSLDLRVERGFDALPARNVSSVVHFAGAMPAHMSGYEPGEYIESIMGGTLNVLEYARRSGAGSIVFSHSISDVLHLFGSGIPIPPDAPRGFPKKGDHSVYSVCKNAAVDLIEHYHCQYGLRRFVLRLPTIYAYHPNPFYFVDGKKKWMAFRLIMDQASRGAPIEIWGDPSSAKEIVYVKDFAQIVRKAVECVGDGGLYNVGRGVGVSLEEQVRGIIEVFSPRGRESDVVYRAELPNSPRFVFDISRTMDELGYAPRYGYKDYLVDFKREMELNRFRKMWGTREDY